ncbi:MAG: AAA family ATPase [Bacteroidales bacterium]|nr:AAA family ATPase [Bacteroidales bacterium]
MITRIKIHGFKSLIETELFFGPFTCIAGANAIGKSNFFDALIFLSNLADKTIIEAAKSVRSENQKHSNIRDIFYKSGENYLEEMRFEIDLLIPKSGIDDLGQTADATITSLRYILNLRLNKDGYHEPIEIVYEELLPITQTQTKTSIYFGYQTEWIKSVLIGRRSTKIPFISTDGDKIKLHQDGNKGRSTEFIASKMPRTLLSTVTAESPTAFLVRQELRNWTMLQLEPSALRQPNSIYEVKNATISANGLNLPATLFRLHSEKKHKDVYQILTNRIKGLVEDVDEILIDKDEKRDLLTLNVKFKDGLCFPAQSLSDGTLRFLGLAILEEDSEGSSLICLEEPENGINPNKIQEMIELLEDMAMDTTSELSEDNPMRQVIINTHSPIVVSSVKDESLYLAKKHIGFLTSLNKKVTYTKFSALKNTWKTRKISSIETTTPGEIATYLESRLIKNNLLQVNEEKPEYSPDKSLTVSENVARQLKFDF